MKIFLKIIRISLIFIIITSTLNLNVFAAPQGSVGEHITGTIFGGWGYWMQDDTDMDIDINIGNSNAISSSNQMIGRLIGMLQAIGSVISIIALIIIGFRYMLSSVEEKAQMKGILIYYIVGAVLVFATSNVLGLAYTVISGI